MASSPVVNTHKRPRGHGFSAESLCLDICDGVYSSCDKRWRPQIVQKVSSSSSSSVHPSSVAVFTGKEDKGTALYSRSHGLSASVCSSASALTDTAGSSAVSFSLPRDCAHGEQQILCCASSDGGVGSCCGGDDATSELDIAGFLLHEGWDELSGCEGGDALVFSPETIFLNGGPPTDCSEEVAFTGCSAENGNWFLNELEGEGQGYLNEVLDQEWMAAAMANLDRINDTLDADLCVMHLFEAAVGV